MFSCGQKKERERDRGSMPDAMGVSLIGIVSAE
jgi:hypothetical protein